MKHPLLAGVLISLLLTAALTNAASTINFEAIDDLPPGEQYRQLNLVLMIFGGADSALIDSMLSSSISANNTNGASFDPDAYKTPLTRIVDQESMLTGAAVLLQFAQDSQDDIQVRLDQISSENPVLISMADLNAITEDAIIIRNAIADSVSFSGLANTPDLEKHLQDYRTRTIRLRNIMEYDAFSVELDRLTQEAIMSVGGKLDAYQRMFDEEVNSTGFSKQIESAEFIYNRDAEFDEKAGKMTEEIMRNMILSESQVDP
jgi:hypothetical protein